MYSRSDAPNCWPLNSDSVVNRQYDCTLEVTVKSSVLLRLTRRAWTSSVKSYWRLTTLSEFNGQQFGAPEREYIDTDSLDASEIPQTVAVRQQIRIASLGSFWVPAAADPVDVSSTESLLFHGDSSTIIRERGNLFPGLGYTVTSVVPTFTAEQLRAATAFNPPG